ncbi:hypothetical protein ACJX0J_017278 [Zea mays]
MKELLLRLVYAEMLGHDASFGHIHAVKMTHDESLPLKRTGYLAVALFLDERHDLVILVVNTIQKDLRSDNYLVVCAALTAACRLIGEEAIPAVLPQVVELLAHPKEAVRKKAVMALHRFYQRSPSSVSHLVSNFRKRLCDNDPGVMGATLCPLYDLILEEPNSYKDLVVSFVNILKQVAERRLPTSYDYHQMPAPFIQIKLLKILAVLGSGDKQASGHMYTVLGDIFRKGDTASNIGNAILYECICCISFIFPNPKMLEAAAETTSKFLKSDSHNLKYMGIDALGRLIKINPDIAEEHQLAVIDCLEDPDDTLKRKTFELLYKMTKSTNVEVIVDRMIEYMINITDHHYKTEIASRCVELAEQFAPSNQWFIQTMNKVFEHAGDLVNIRVAHNLMRLIAEGFGEEDEGADSQLRSSAVDSYLRIVGEPKLPSSFLQIICWVLGEYGTADGKYSASYIIGKLCDVAEAHLTDDTVKAYAISAILKTFAFEITLGRKIDLLPECQTLMQAVKTLRCECWGISFPVSPEQEFHFTHISHVWLVAQGFLLVREGRQTERIYISRLINCAAQAPNVINQRIYAFGFNIHDMNNGEKKQGGMNVAISNNLICGWLRVFFFLYALKLLLAVEKNCNLVFFLIGFIQILLAADILLIVNFIA